MKCSTQLILFLSLATIACGQAPTKENQKGSATLGPGLTFARPEDVGLSSTRLARIGTMVQGKIDAGEIPGAVVLVARDGKVAYVEAFGYAHVVTNARLTRDSIFRIASMTKGRRPPLRPTTP